MSRMHKIEDLLHKEIASIIVTRIDNQDVKNTVTIGTMFIANKNKSLLSLKLNLLFNLPKVNTALICFSTKFSRLLKSICF